MRKKNHLYIHEEFFLVHDIIIGILILVCIISAWYLGGFAGFFLNLAVILLLFLWIFFTVNVMLGKERLSVYFNAPIIKRDIPYTEIAHCTVATGKWWRGYRSLQPDKKPTFPLGISFSSKALVITFKNQKKRPIIIGTRHAEQLCDEINRRSGNVS